MSNVTPPLITRAPTVAPGSPLRGTLKGALATLVLLLLALLFWQLLDQLRETQKNQRQYTIDYTADLAAQVSLNMALNAQIALNLLPIVEQPQSADEQQDAAAQTATIPARPAQPRTAQPLREESSATVPPTARTPTTWRELVRRSRAQAHYFSNADDGSVVHLLLHQASGSTRGYWALRLTPTFFASLTKQNETGIRPLWLVENRFNHQIISRDQALPAVKPGHPDPGRCGQQRADRAPEQQRLATARAVRPPARARSNCCRRSSANACWAWPFPCCRSSSLLNMRRRQRQLHEGRRRYQDIFEGTGVALCVLDLSGLKQLLRQGPVAEQRTTASLAGDHRSNASNCCRNCASPRSIRSPCNCSTSTPASKPGSC